MFISCSPRQVLTGIPRSHYTFRPVVLVSCGKGTQAASPRVPGIRLPKSFSSELPEGELKRKGGESLQMYSQHSSRMLHTPWGIRRRKPLAWNKGSTLRRHSLLSSVQDPSVYASPLCHSPTPIWDWLIITLICLYSLFSSDVISSFVFVLFFSAGSLALPHTDYQAQTRIQTS